MSVHGTSSGNSLATAREMLRRLADDLQVADHGIDGLAIGQKLLEREADHI
jgi:hypothetical protein